MALPSIPPAQSQTPDSRPQTLKWLVRLGLGLLIVAALAGRGGGADIGRVLGSVSWPVLLGSVLFYWAGQLLSAAKWQVLLRARGAALPFRECCRLYLVGMFWNLWMPTNIGGDAARIYLAAPRCGGKAVAAASVLVERLTGLGALLAIGLAGLAWAWADDANSAVPGGVPERALTPHGEAALRLLAAIAGTLLLLALGLLCARALARRLERRAPHNRLARSWAGLHRALDAYARPETRGAIAVAMLLSLLFQASQVLLNIALARAVGLALPGAVFWWLVPALALASLLPVGVGGLGVREAAAVTLLQGSGLLSAGAMNHNGAAVATVVAWSLLWQATIWIASLPGILWRGSRAELRLERG